MAQAEREEMSRWVHEHGPSLLGYLTVRLGDRHAAEELVQEVFCRAWEARDRYQEQGRARGYLFRIAERLLAHRRVKDARARGSSHDLEQAVDQRVDPALFAENAEEGRRLRLALEGLSGNQRDTLLLRYFSQLEFHEIARVLDCPLNTALSHARRGLAALRKVLEESPR